MFIKNREDLTETTVSTLTDFCSPNSAMNVSGENLDQLLASATKNGMYLVDDSNTDALEKEYDEETIVVDKLCETIDPETAPFESKYKARTILDTLCNKLEATRTIASLEKKRDVVERMNRKIGDKQ